MDKNTIIGLALIFAIFIGFTIYNTPSGEELERQRYVRDSIQKVREQEEFSRAQASQVEEKSQQQMQPEKEIISSITPDDPELRDRLGIFAGGMIGEPKEFVIENDLLKIRLSNIGGKIINVELKDYQTFDSLPLVLFNNDDATFGYTFFANSRRISTNELIFEPHYPDTRWQDAESMTVSGKDSLRFAMRLYATTHDGTVDRSRYIENLYVIYGDDYMIDLRLSIIGLEESIDRAKDERIYFGLLWEADLKSQEKNIEGEQNETTIYYKSESEGVKNLSETKDDSKIKKDNFFKIL
ncbi:MAG: hypothetical protein EOM23_08460 [Candidatus Moranbacteria bacterium]|nr:hypothetical protein [Candidatus Moranbacteria bacterium]